ncbi:hypothetical protein D3C85_783690 [compost metagenome]
MAATVYTCQLHESKGLCKVIYFSGLKFDLIIHPYVYGEPLVTTQSLYFLEDLGSIAKLRVEHPNTITDNEMEYLIDNYLFKYSLSDDLSKVCAKITTPAFWAPDFSDFYQYHDKRNTRALTLDPYNDDSILEISDIDGSQWAFSDYCFPKEFINDALSESAIKIKSLFERKILVKIIPNEERDGYFGKLRLLKSDGYLLDYTQAINLDWIDFYNIKDKAAFSVKSHLDDSVLELPIQRVDCNKTFSPTLLSYYFSGLRERNVLLSFIGYYNVLEHYFEEASAILGNTNASEKINLRTVVSLITNHSDLYTFITNNKSLQYDIVKDVETSSGINIKGVVVNDDVSLLADISDWLYTIRCAVVHSKKMRKGKLEAIFEPYTSQSENIVSALVVIKWLSQKCIIKDHELKRAVGLISEA